MPDSLSTYDVFVSYARVDNQTGWVSGLVDAIRKDFQPFSSPPVRIFFDISEIRSRQDWELRLRQGLRASRVLLVCLSPNYLRSVWCRREWEEFARLQARRPGGGDAVTGVYFVDLGGDERYTQEIVAWRREVERVQFEQLQPWFPSGVEKLQEVEVRRRVEALGLGISEQLRQARLAKEAPGNLRRHNPWFVGRTDELRTLRHQLAGGAVGVVTAIHGLGGVGKTELAVTYAHAYSAAYQGGVWQVDADGQSDILEAVSALALSPELGLQLSQDLLRDRQRLGRLVLARLAELIAAASDRGVDDAACFLLLDNVSEAELLSLKQLSKLPQQPWLHVAVTTRLGITDVAAVGSRASVALVEVDRLAAEDALMLLREHQPARDLAGLSSDFSGSAEASAAKEIVVLLDGYALAVEQAAVYLGTGAVEPSELLALLRARGTVILDEVGTASAAAGDILHQQKIAGLIVDQTLKGLSDRALDALRFACLLPADSIPWGWLQKLTDSAEGAVSAGLPGLLGGDDWKSTRRLLEGRRLLTQSDDPHFGQQHRVLQEHIRIRLKTVEAERHLAAHLQSVVDKLASDAIPDLSLLTVTAAALTTRIVVDYSLVTDGIALVNLFRGRLDLSVTEGLATATLTALEHLATANPEDVRYQRLLSMSLTQVGDVSDNRGDVQVALDHYTRALRIAERLPAADSDTVEHQRELSLVLKRLGGLLADRGEAQSALVHYTRALQIGERLAAADPGNTQYQHDLSRSLEEVGNLLIQERGEAHPAVEYVHRALQIAERLASAHPTNLEYRTSLIWRLITVGELFRASGEMRTALEHFNRALAIAERLAGTDPTNLEYQHTLTGALGTVARQLQEHDEPRAALDHFARAAHIAERLANADPTNLEHQRNQSAMLVKAGDLLDDLGDTQAARDNYARGLRIAERLAGTDPTNVDHKLALSISRARVCSLLAKHGNIQAAVDQCDSSAELFRQLAEEHPGVTAYRCQVADASAAAGDLLIKHGDVPRGLHYYGRCLDIRESLAIEQPTPEHQHELYTILTTIGDARISEGDIAGGEFYMRSLRVLEQLSTAYPANLGYQRDFAQIDARVAELCERTGLPQATKHFARAYRTLQSLEAAAELAQADRDLMGQIAEKLELGPPNRS